MKWVASALKKHAVYRLMSVLAALGMSSEVFSANCWMTHSRVGGASTDMSAGVDVSSNLPLYTLLRIPVVEEYSLALHCGAMGANGMEGSLGYEVFLGSPIGSTLIDGVEHEVYPSSVPGVGWAVAGQLQGRQWVKGPPGLSQLVRFTNSPGSFRTTYKYSFAWVSTGSLSTGNYRVADLQPTRFVFTYPDPRSPAIHSDNLRTGGDLRVIVRTCQVSDVIVNMGDQRSADFDSPASMRDVVIRVSGCPSGGSVTYVVDGNQVQGLLSIENSGAGSADGVAIQLLKADGFTPLALGTAYVADGYNPTGEVQAPPFDIRLKARYRVIGPVSNGAANASATVTMTYQ